MTKNEYYDLIDKVAQFEELTKQAGSIDRLLNDLANGAEIDHNGNYFEIRSRSGVLAFRLTKIQLTEFINWLKTYHAYLLEKIDNL